MTIPNLQSQIDPVTWGNNYGDIYEYIVVGDYLYMAGYSYITLNAMLMVWDISDITNPQLVNTLGSGTYLGYYDVIYHNGCLYVTASDWVNDNPIIVFSLANPALPVVVDSIGSPGAPYYTYTIPLIVRSGNYLFSVGDAEYNGPMVIFDISVQNTITKHSEVSRPGGKWANNPVFFNDHVLISSSGTDDLYNVSDINNIVLVTSTFTQFDWITAIYGDYAWVGEVTGAWEYYANVWNISDPTNVTFVAQYPPGTKDGEPAPYYFGAKGFNIRSSDGKAYGIYENGASNCGVSEHNIIDPTNVVLTDRDHNAIYCVGNWWGDMVFDGTSIIFWSRGTGLMIWGISAITISGNVTNGLGQNLEDVTITLTDSVDYEAVTGSDGNYSQVVDPDIYDVIASILGNEDQSASVDASSSDKTQDFVFPITTAPHDKAIPLKSRYLLED